MDPARRSRPRRAACLRALPRATLRLLLLIAGLAALVVPSACSPPPQARASDTRIVLLLGCRTFGGSTRVATLLDDIAAATDVLGDTRFVIESPPGCRPEDLPVLLGRHPEAAIAIAVVGDLAALDGVDPSEPPHALERLTSRRLPLEALREVLGRLEQTARAQGTTLLLATAPLGRPAHVEVPELDAVAELLRERGAALDLAADFRALEPAPLFTNDFDRLDDFGHDALANALFQRCLQDGGPIPARNAAERSARLQARALAAFHADREAEFAQLAALALGAGAGDRTGGPTGAADLAADSGAAPASPRHAARLAAIASARDGLTAAAPRWEAITGPADGVPGLALGRTLLRAARIASPGSAPDDSPPAAAPAQAEGPDEFEAELVAVLQALARVDDDTRALAGRCVEAHPERLPAWLALQVVSLALPPMQDVRGDARRQLALCPREAVPESLLSRIFRNWPAPVDDLPALLLAERQQGAMLPTGPLLETARRRAALGYVDHALELLRDGLKGLAVPPAWERERQRIDALPRG